MPSICLRFIFLVERYSIYFNSVRKKSKEDSCPNVYFQGQWSIYSIGRWSFWQGITYSSIGYFVHGTVSAKEELPEFREQRDHLWLKWLAEALGLHLQGQEKWRESKDL